LQLHFRKIPVNVRNTLIKYANTISLGTGKLHMLWIECTRCARKGRYSVAKLLAQHGHRGNMSKWVSDLRGDCHKRNAAQLHERRDLICPDLLKAL
jgi:hypothetical protein